MLGNPFAAELRSNQASAARYKGLAAQHQAQQNVIKSNAASAARLNAQVPKPASKPMPLGPAAAFADSLKNLSIPKYTPPKILVDGGDEDLTSTDKSSNRKPPPYPTTPRPLNAQELQALSDRRLAVDNAYKEAMAAQERGEGAAKAAALAQRQMVNTDFRRSSRDFMSEMAGRGLARSPMLAGRGMRRMQQDRERTYGQIDNETTTQISALQEMVNRARIERDMEMSRISQDEALMRSNPWDYLMLANEYLGG